MLSDFGTKIKAMMEAHQGKIQKMFESAQAELDKTAEDIESKYDLTPDPFITDFEQLLNEHQTKCHNTFEQWSKKRSEKIDKIKEKMFQEVKQMTERSRKQQEDAVSNYQKDLKAYATQQKAFIRGSIENQLLSCYQEVLESHTNISESEVELYQAQIAKEVHTQAAVVSVVDRMTKVKECFARKIQEQSQKVLEQRIVTQNQTEESLIQQDIQKEVKAILDIMIESQLEEGKGKAQRNKERAQCYRDMAQDVQQYRDEALRQSSQLIIANFSQFLPEDLKDHGEKALEELTEKLREADQRLSSEMVSSRSELTLKLDQEHQEKMAGFRKKLDKVRSNRQELEEQREAKKRGEAGGLETSSVHSVPDNSETGMAPKLDINSVNSVVHDNSQTGKAQELDKNAINSVVQDNSKTGKAQELDKNPVNSVVQDNSETGKGQELDKNPVNSVVQDNSKTGKAQELDKNPINSVVQDNSETGKAQELDTNVLPSEFHLILISMVFCLP